MHIESYNVKQRIYINRIENNSILDWHMSSDRVQRLENKSIVRSQQGHKMFQVTNIRTCEQHVNKFFNESFIPKLISVFTWAESRLTWPRILNHRLGHTTPHIHRFPTDIQSFNRRLCYFQFIPFISIQQSK